jgi:hypothetical protein
MRPTRSARKGDLTWSSHTSEKEINYCCQLTSGADVVVSYRQGSHRVAHLRGGALARSSVRYRYRRVSGASGPVPAARALLRSRQYGDTRGRVRHGRCVAPRPSVGSREGRGSRCRGRSDRDVRDGHGPGTADDLAPPPSTRSARRLQPDHAGDCRSMRSTQMPTRLCTAPNATFAPAALTDRCAS